MLAIVDYGMGNLRSVQKSLERVGLPVRVVNTPAQVAEASGVVLPGVGAFADAMHNLQKTGLGEAVCRAIAAGKPYLGICLGLQILFEHSEEWGGSPGLGILPGRVRRLPDLVKVPHMGWNQVDFTGECPLFAGIPAGSHFYFVHSYYCAPTDANLVAGRTVYGVEFASAVWRDNIMAIQFHPEKSSRLGLQVLENFGRLVEKC
ncbi:imidazole glycerol phosphate synthase subunit HisH [Desulfurispora thermophila]|uniref:imidazole glycerol phosphate synthase subunit HisH n=1 Tax=Desulfurispora thermophila TaxID=265470 RepID=UPI00036BAC7C|nr:imidazole glycerol phosphate synthase subunit HisH [Desulfurispora thermophila]